ncbi:MAG: hypothetical protein MJA27_15385 [Pseudanabaenales cyanobacterium]|nr:hypothetical protein [Pseudanabaenales cyanobacterium]
MNRSSSFTHLPKRPPKHPPKRHPKRRRSSTAIISFSSTLFAIAGGILLALNIEVSQYGFLLLAGSSSQMLIANLLLRNRCMIAYSLSLFLFVDCLGIWRWVLS